MPVYEYDCENCGLFNRRRPMLECALPATCPSCGVSAPRLISPPRLALVSTATRTAHDTNERSAERPHTSNTWQGTHPAGCSCCSGNSGKTTDVQPAYKSRTGARPWMISH
ncbi:FmdB family zinc ribbon protein [Kushneria aurantia]|uniref:FmdB family zinc ribbon protein n=1 Tax=Kushneria aurantia TaxID=504092 RepID=A0ABV6G048_9GAMM